MDRRTGQGLMAAGLLAVLLGVSPRQAQAQFGTYGMSPSPAPTAANMAGVNTSGPGAGNAGWQMMANPYMNPLLNPYMNPLATQTSQGQAGNPALYFLAAQQLNGGLGSGRLGGPYAQTPQAAAKAAREARGGAAALASAAGPAKGGANTPGGSASNYFGRTFPSTPNNTRYYGRQNRHFPQVGK